MTTIPKEDWKQNIKDYVDSIDAEIYTVRLYPDTYKKLVDAGEGHMTTEKRIDVIEIWYK